MQEIKTNRRRGLSFWVSTTYLALMIGVAIQLVYRLRYIHLIYTHKKQMGSDWGGSFLHSFFCGPLGVVSPGLDITLFLFVLMLGTALVFQLTWKAKRKKNNSPKSV
jgi:hypothetical protein